MRSDIKDKDYFDKYLAKAKTSMARDLAYLNEGKVVPDRIEPFRQASLTTRIHNIVANYTAGASSAELKRVYLETLSYVPEWWSSATLEGGGKPYGSILLNQLVLTHYDEMLWMLSLGFLLDVPETDFKILVSAIDKFHVRDLIFETIIKAKIPSRDELPESYTEHRLVPEVFTSLRKAIETSDKAEATKLITQFLKKEWYKNHKDVSWHNNHKSRHDTFFGYWSFETAAIVKIKRLNNEDFNGLPYYPGDLV